MKIPLPPIQSDTFKVTGISLGTRRLAVINGKECVEGNPVEVPHQPGWTVAQIRDDSVVLDYYGNYIAVPLTLSDNTKRLSDQLRPLK